MRDVDAFLNDAPRLLDQFRVDDRQKRRVVSNVVRDDQQDRHTHSARVMQYIALVFDVLDDRDQNARIALPKKYAINVGNRIAVTKFLISR